MSDIENVTKKSYINHMIIVGCPGNSLLFRQKDSPEITFKRNRIRYWPVSSVVGLDNFYNSITWR